MKLRAAETPLTLSIDFLESLEASVEAEKRREFHIPLVK